MKVAVESQKVMIVKEEGCHLPFLHLSFLLLLGFRFHPYGFLPLVPFRVNKCFRRIQIRIDKEAVALHNVHICDDILVHSYFQKAVKEVVVDHVLKKIWTTAIQFDLHICVLYHDILANLYDGKTVRIHLLNQ